MNYKLNLGAWNSVFAVPAAVVDNYIKLAGGNNLKVLLLVLRNAGNEISAEEIARKTGVSSDDVQDALLFWEQTGLFAVSEHEIVPGESETVETVPLKALDKATVSPIESLSPDKDKKANSVRKPYYTPGEIARAVREDKGMDFLFTGAERIYGEPLSHSRQNTLMYITAEAGVTAECALMLVEYCHTEKKPSSYMKMIAEDWYNREINTAVLAEEEIKALQELNSLENKLKKLFEMKSKFSRNNKDLIRKWSDWGYDEEMIDEAYQITLNATGQMSFPYMDKIITNWNSNGIKNKEQLEKSQKSHKENLQKSNETAKSSFDLDKISRLINEK